MKLKTKSWVYGILGSVILFTSYLISLTLLNSFYHSILQFGELWYLMLPLIIGFGVQVGLFVYVKNYCKQTGIEKVSIGAGGGISGIAMVACCSHNLVGLFALIGIAGAALFLAKYQTIFLLIGIIANIFGIFYTLNHLKKVKGGK